MGIVHQSDRGATCVNWYRFEDVPAALLLFELFELLVVLGV